MRTGIHPALINKNAFNMWPESVENPFYSTSGIFKPISGL
jgi:hypothetical protein